MRASGITSIPDAFADLLHLKKLQVEGNPGLKSYPYSSIEGCDVTFYETAGGTMCSLCPEWQSEALLPLLCFLIAGFMGCVLVYRIASAPWRPSNRPGAECVIHSGRFESAKEATEVWREALETHLDLSEAEVEIDHAFRLGLEVGDEIMILEEPEQIAKNKHHLGACLGLPTAVLVLVFSGGASTALTYIVPLFVFCVFTIIPIALCMRCCKEDQLATTAKGLGTVLELKDDGKKVIATVHGKSGHWKIGAADVRKMPALSGGDHE